MAKPSAQKKTLMRINPQDIPLTIKLKAWWEGYDPVALYKMVATTQKMPQSVSPAGHKSVSGGKSARGASAKVKTFHWTEQRAAAAQLVWGSGFLEPHLPLETRQLARKLDMKPGQVLLNIGAGLGGYNRYLAETLGYQIDGYDVRGEVVALGAKIPPRDAAAKAPNLLPFESERDQPLARRYDRLLITHGLGRMASVPALLAPLSRNLKPGSKYVIFDWFRSPSCSKSELSALLAKCDDGQFVSMTDSVETAKLLGAYGFKISENSLATSDAVEALTKPWRQVVQSITAFLHDMDRRDLIDELLAEAELWTLRATLANENHIEARLFSGVYTGRGDL